MTRKAYLSLIRQKAARGGTLGHEEARSLKEIRHIELARRHDAMFGSGLLCRRFNQLYCAVLASFKPTTPQGD